MLTYLTRIRPYDIIASITGFALLAYELAASRILAPSIGSSTYVWTSVIGVIIAALSLGYAAGGVVADKRVQPHDIAWLLLASALGVAMTLVFATGTLETITAIKDQRLQGLVASLLLFMPASFVLGMISPYLARLRTLSLSTTGRSVASLSALNAIGGIVGTFCVGFIFFSYIGTKETLVFISLLLLAASWLIMPKQHVPRRAAMTTIILVVLLLQLAPQKRDDIVADIDTPTSRYQVAEAAQAGQAVRVLTTGPKGSQSGVYTDGSNQLVFGYTRQMAHIVQQAPQKDRLLILGGGAFTLPTYLADHYPHAQIDVVEIDPQLVDIAKQYFNYQERPNVRVLTQDARAFLNTNRTPYDIILVDVYTDTSIPFTTATTEFTTRIKQSLQPQGIVVLNAIGSLAPGCAPLLANVHTAYMHAFSHYALFPQATHDLRVLQNLVITYANTPLGWLPSHNLALPQGTALTDNFAPIERLQQQCWDEQS